MAKIPNQKREVKQRDAERSKRALIEAAQKHFSAHGYAEVGLRDIAASAKVNIALVAHYFGSKLGLFAAALDNALPPKFFVETRREGYGDALVAFLLKIEETHAAALPMLLYAANNSDTRTIALELLQKRVIAPLRRSLGDDADAEIRAARLLAVSMGFFTFQRLLPLRSMETEAALRWLAKSFQDIVEEDF